MNSRVGKWLTIIGLVFTLLGAAAGTYGVWLSPNEAIERGVSRLSGDVREQNLELPAVQNFLQESQLCRSWFCFNRVRHALADHRRLFSRPVTFRPT